MSREQSPFAGRVCAITGAASGIGRALAVELASRGADLALCDVNREGLEETARRARLRGRAASTWIVDVSDRDAVHRFADEVIREHERVDAIVNNAGVSLSQTFEECRYEDIEWVLRINLWGVIHGTKAFLPHLRQRDTGWIVNISSVFGMVGAPTQSAYNVAKFGVRGLTESLWQELADTGITVTSVHPGGIRTNIVRSGRFYRDERGGEDREGFVRRFDKLARTSAEEAGRVIADGMERRAPRVLIGTDARIIDTIARTAPTRYPQISRALFGLGRRRRRRDGT
ncbi:MAG: SDR family NAD(P)-dependent oxidoreductase [Sandaracinaceae bacterium]